VHTAYDLAPHNHSQHKQCRTPYAVIHGLVLLMMGIMMPETCSYRSLIINIGLVASCWFISLHPTFLYLTRSTAITVQTFVSMLNGLLHTILLLISRTRLYSSWSKTCDFCKNSPTYFHSPFMSHILVHNLPLLPPHKHIRS